MAVVSIPRVRKARTVSGTAATAAVGAVAAHRAGTATVLSSSTRWTRSTTHASCTTCAWSTGSTPIRLSGCRHAGRRRATSPRDLSGVPVAWDTGWCRRPARAAGAEAALPLRAACPAVSVQGGGRPRR